jgi:iron(III) transport system ATP-binding protein
MADDYLVVRNVSKMFGRFQALRDVSLTVRRGEFMSFLGPSGCGKTTLLRAISGLDPQTTGSIHQAGRDISRLPPGERDFGIVFQSYALFPNLTIAANVAYGLRGRKMDRKAIAERVASLLETVGLADQGTKYPSQLSGGQQQRVALARALAPSPGLLLLDEPLSALDARVRARLRGEIRDLQQRLGITTIMVTHDQEEALTMADRIVVMNTGVIDQVGTPMEIYGRPETLFVADFIGKINCLEGHLLDTETVEVAGARLRVPVQSSFAVGNPVTICLRPEDVVLRQVNGGANGFDVDVGVMEFVGNHFSTTLHVPGTHLNLSADLSMNVVRDLGIAPGTRIKVQVPPERLRVFGMTKTPKAEVAQ